MSYILLPPKKLTFLISLAENKIFDSFYCIFPTDTLETFNRYLRYLRYIFKPLGGQQEIMKKIVLHYFVISQPTNRKKFVELNFLIKKRKE